MAHENTRCTEELSALDGPLGHEQAEAFKQLWQKNALPAAKVPTMLETLSQLEDISSRLDTVSRSLPEATLERPAALRHHRKQLAEDLDNLPQLRNVLTTLAVLVYYHKAQLQSALLAELRPNDHQMGRELEFVEETYMPFVFAYLQETRRLTVDVPLEFLERGKCELLSLCYRLQLLCTSALEISQVDLLPRRMIELAAEVMLPSDALPRAENHVQRLLLMLARPVVLAAGPQLAQLRADCACRQLREALAAQLDIQAVNSLIVVLEKCLRKATDCKETLRELGIH